MSVLHGTTRSLVVVGIAVILVCGGTVAGASHTGTVGPDAVLGTTGLGDASPGVESQTAGGGDTTTGGGNTSTGGGDSTTSGRNTTSGGGNGSATNGSATTGAGVTLTGAFTAERTTLDGQFQSATYEVRLARADGDAARAAVLESIRADLRTQLEGVETTRERLATTEARPPGAVVAERTAADVTAVVVARLAESSRQVAERLAPDLLPVDLLGTFTDLLEDALALARAGSVDTSAVESGLLDVSDYDAVWGDTDIENETVTLQTPETTVDEPTLTLPEETLTETPTLTDEPLTTPTATPTLPDGTLTTPTLTETPTLTNVSLTTTVLDTTLTTTVPDTTLTTTLLHLDGGERSRGDVAGVPSGGLVLAPAGELAVVLRDAARPLLPLAPAIPSLSADGS